MAGPPPRGPFHFSYDPGSSGSTSGNAFYWVGGNPNYSPDEEGVRRTSDGELTPEMVLVMQAMMREGLLRNRTSSPPPQKRCVKCGAQATMTHQATNTHFCHVHFLEAKRARDIKNAEAWIIKAFESTRPEMRSKLYRQLSLVYHPDAYGDDAIMLALNSVYERMPK